MKLTRTIQYESDLSLDTAKHKLAQYFKMSMSSFSKRYRISGFFISDTEFEFRHKGQMVFFRPPYKRPAYISGRFEQPPHGNLRVTLTFRWSLIWSPLTLATWLLFPHIVFLIKGINAVPLRIIIMVILFQVTTVVLGFYLTDLFYKRRIEHLLKLRKPNFQ